MGEEEKSFERIPPIRPGDEVLRRVRKRRKLRIAPNVPRFFRFLKDTFSTTPVLPLLLALVVLWLLFSAGMYFAESGAGGGITSYGRALYWGVAAFSTAGIADTPITGAGQVIGAIWIVTGASIFFGAIVATITAYFMLPRRRPSTEIAATIQYNLEKLDDLSMDELEVLKGATDRLIEVRIERFRREAPTK
jgi:voltage-gated potassium channel